jgi:hypothetical protein
MKERTRLAIALGLGFLAGAFTTAGLLLLRGR